MELLFIKKREELVWEEVDQEFGLGYVMFKVFIKYLGRDVEKVVKIMSIDFKGKVQVIDINLNEEIIKGMSVIKYRRGLRIEFWGVQCLEVMEMWNQ